MGVPGPSPWWHVTALAGASLLVQPGAATIPGIGVWAHGIGASGREPSSATFGARIASRTPSSIDQAKVIVSRPRYGRSTKGTVTVPSGR